MNTFITIPKRSLHCSHGGERLCSGMEYYSLLTYDERQQMLRQDFCVACWQEFMSSLSLENKNHGYWKSRVETKLAATPSLNKVEQALVLLRELSHSSSVNEGEIFILALFLERAKRLILRQEFEKEGEVYVLYEIQRQNEFITIKKVELSAIEIQCIQQTLLQKFKLTS